MPSIVAVTGSETTGKTGGEQYNSRLLNVAEQAGFSVSYITFQHSCLDKLMGLPLLWRLRFLTRSMQLILKLWCSSGDVWLDVWFAPYAKLWAKYTSRNIILMVHHLRGELEQDKQVQAAEAALIRAAAHILTVSQSSQRQIQQYLESDTCIDIIPPGFERPKMLPTQQQTNDTVQLLFVGHITKAKGVLDVLQAMALLSDMDCVLHVVGGGAAEPETWEKAESFIVEHGLSDKITMHGRVEDEQLQALYQQADVFVLPSYWEGYGIVFLEAMSLGLPVVSTTAGAISEVVVHEKTGLLVQAGDVQTLSQALRQLIMQPELREKLAKAALAYAKEAADWQQTELKFSAWWQKRVQDV